MRPGSPSEEPTQTTSAVGGALDRRRASSAGGTSPSAVAGTPASWMASSCGSSASRPQHLAGLLEGRPRLAREQPGRDPRGGEQQAQPGGHYCCGASGAGAPGVAVAEGAAGFSQFGAGAVERQLLAVERAVAGVDRDLGLADLGQDRRAGLLAQRVGGQAGLDELEASPASGSLISLTAARAWSSETPLPSFSRLVDDERRQDQRDQACRPGVSFCWTPAPC